MNVVVAPSVDGSLPSWAPRRRFDVVDYRRMADAGILAEADHSELIDGEIIDMSPIGGPHIGAVMALVRHFVLAARDAYCVSAQSPVRLDAWSEPEPDVALLELRSDDYRGDPPPSGSNAVLLVEVSDTTLRYDTEVKVPLYARHGIPEVWIVDLSAETVTTYRKPEHGTYQSIETVPIGRQVAALALPGAGIVVSALMRFQ